MKSNNATTPVFFFIGSVISKPIGSISGILLLYLAIEIIICMNGAVSDCLTILNQFVKYLMRNVFVLQPHLTFFVSLMSLLDESFNQFYSAENKMISFSCFLKEH